MDFEGMEFRDAAKAAGRDIPQNSRSCPRPQAGEESQLLRRIEATSASDVWKEKASNFAAACHDALLRERRVLDWLDQRGIPGAAAVRFHLGWNRGDGKRPCLWRPRSVWGLPDVPGKGGAKDKTLLWLPRGLVIPQLDADGRVLRLRIRRPEEDREELPLPYYVVPGSGMSPLWVPQQPGTLPPDAAALVVESELDAMACAHAAGDLCSVLGLMTARVRGLPSAVMGKLSACARILVATDVGDKDLSGGRGWEIWRETFPQARRWPCVGGKDPGDMVKFGRGIRPWVLAGLPGVFVEAARAKETGADGREGARGIGGVPEESRKDVREEVLEMEHEPDESSAHPRFPIEAYGREPAERLEWPHDAQHALAILSRAGLKVQPLGDDFMVTGQERWGAEGRFRLLCWMHKHGDLVLCALRERGKGEGF
jgi:hypothetical protein